MQRLSKLQKWTFISISFFIVLGTFLLFLTYKNLGLENKKIVIRNTEKTVLKELESLETQLQNDFKDAQKLTDNYAKIMGEYPKLADTLAHSFPDLFKGYNFSALGIHPSEEYSTILLQHTQTYRLKTEKQLWSPFFKQGQKKVTAFPYDYTGVSGGKWYSEKIKTGSWTVPYSGSANNSLVVSYRSPIIRDFQKDENDGVVCLDYALGYIQQEVAKLNLLRKGYGIIINKDSTIISHPSSRYLGKKINEVLPKETLHGIKKLVNNKFLPINQYNDRIIDRELYFKYTLNVANTPSPIVYTAIIILQESETLASNNSKNENPIQRVKSLQLIILCGLILTLSLLVFWAFLLFDIRKVWLLILLQSATYILGILLIIYVQLKTPLYSFSNTDTEITNTTELDAYLNAFKREHESKKPFEVKTGFHIQNAKFSSANDLSITGSLWQQVTNPEAIISHFKGEELSTILHPDFPEAESSNFELVSEKDGRIEWSFSAEIRQSFDYSNYPFDEVDIWLRTRPKRAYQDDLLFIPDFDSYLNFASQNDYYLNPSIPKNELNNGLEDGLFIKGWDIIRTSFSIRDRMYNTSFGKFTFEKSYTHPELYFNVSVKRRFLEVFVVYFIPILVTAFLLFTVLMTYTRNSKINELYGFNVSTVLGFCGGLFFVIIVSHMSLRESLQTGGIIYLEYFFFCLYFLITVVSIGAFLFSSSSAPDFFKKNNGEIVKMMYWPLFCFIVFLLTALHFTNF